MADFELTGILRVETDADGNLKVTPMGFGARSFNPGDVLPPTIPVVDAALTGRQEITVSWGVSTDVSGVTEYRIRKRGDTTYLSHAPNSRSRVYSSLQPQSSYQYEVCAVDTYGNVSLWGVSNEVVTLDVLVAPVFTVAPTSVSLPSNGGTIQFTATDANVGETLTYSLVGTRTGFSINSSSGLVSVSPAAVGTSGNISVRATDSSGMSSTTTCSVTVAAVGDVPSIATLQAAGYVVVGSTGYAVTLGTSVTSAQAAANRDSIQRAIDYAFDNARPVYIPSGTYMIDNTIRLFHWDNWSTSNNASSGDSRVHCIHGASINPPVFKLTANNALFANAADPRPVVCERSFKALNVNAVSNSIPAHPFDLPDGTNWKDELGTGFDSTLKYLTIDTNGNPGAIGLTWTTCQDAHASFIKVIGTGSLSCFHGTGGTMGEHNIEGIGGQYGIYYGQFRTATTGSGTCVAGFKLYNQTVASVHVYDYCPTVLVGGHIIKSGSTAQVFEWTTKAWASNNHSVAMIDAVIETGGTGPVFPNVPSRTSYLRNVYVTGTDQLTQYGSNPVKTATGTWKRIDEYSSAVAGTLGNVDGSLYSYNYTQTNGERNLPHRTIIDGVLGSTLNQEVATFTSNVTAPVAAEFFSRHALPFVHMIDGGAYCDVTNSAFAGGAKPFLPVGSWGNGSKLAYESYQPNTQYGNYLSLPGGTGGPPVDASPAFEAAIAAAAAAGHNRVFVPRGYFYLSRTLVLQKDTHLFGVGNKKTSLLSMPAWTPTANTYLVQTVNDATGTASMNDLRIYIRRVWPGTQVVAPGVVDDAGAPCYIYPNELFCHVNWRVGRKSWTHGACTGIQYVNEKYPTQGRQTWTFSGGGGGRHYMTHANGRGNCSKAMRVILANGTTEPLAIYCSNQEIGKGVNSNNLYNPDAGIEVRGASNVRIYAAKREGNAATLWVNGNSGPCRNIALYGAGVQMASRGIAGDPFGNLDRPFFAVTGNCDGILVGISTVQQCERQPSTTQQMIKEAITAPVAKPVFKLYWPDGLALYKRGLLDDSVMRFT